MNSARDKRFNELAMKLVGRECPANEKAELKQILAEEPERQSQLMKLCTSAGVAREFLPLVSALVATEGTMTDEERQAFRAEVTRVFGLPKAPPKSTTTIPVIDIKSVEDDPKARERRISRRRWAGLGIVVVAALLLYSFWPRPRYDIALIQSGFARRWSEQQAFTTHARGNLSSVSVKEFKPDSVELREWENTSSSRTVKLKCFIDGRLFVGLDRIEIVGRWKDRTFQKTIEVKKSDWKAALLEAKAFVDSQR